MAETTYEGVEEVSPMQEAMASEETVEEGTFLTGGNKRSFSELSPEVELDEDFVLNPSPVKDGKELLEFLRTNLHRFDAPFAYLGGEMNSPKRTNWYDADVRILQTRLSTYEAVALSMSHSLMKQIYEDIPGVFVDLGFMPDSHDYKIIKGNHFPVWFGTNTKMSPLKFDVVSISHPVSMEQMSVVACLHDSGIPIFKNQRMDDEDIPIIIMGGSQCRFSSPVVRYGQAEGEGLLFLY